MTGSHICIDTVSRYLVPPEMTDDIPPVLSGSWDEGDSQHNPRDTYHELLAKLQGH